MSMNRRRFLKNSSLAGFVAPALITGMEAGSGTQNTELTAELTAADDVIVEATINDLQQRMKNKTLTSKQLVQLYLNRIQTIDKSGPKINSVIELNPDAIAIAEAMDKERNGGKLRGPLHGIPVLIKDNIDTGDNMMTTAGSIALAGNKASSDAFIAKRLRDAGAVILGKTNLSEFANFRSSSSTSGWSSRGGQTKCPYVLTRNPSGSSAGTGAAVAASLCTIGIGTETDGSIVSPSSVNGLVGIKPTVGLWSRSGIIPISATQDTAGPMTRTLTDAAILLGALTGVDEQDPVTAESKGKAQQDYTQYLDAGGLKGKRIGFDQKMTKGNPDVAALIKNSLDVLKAQGATIVDIELLTDIRPLGNAEFTVLEYEFKDGLNKYLAGANAPVKSLAEVIEFNNAHPDTAMPFFKQETLIGSEEKGGLGETEYKEALAKSTSARNVIDNLLKKHNLDAICGPTNGPAVCIDLVNGDYDNGFSLSSPAAMAGYPHITIPMGFVHQLPVGFSFFSTAYTEPQLLPIAYAFEQATKQRKAPEYLLQVGY